MASNVTIPDFEWYSGISSRHGLFPRCPFASVDRCPRYYQSLSLLGEAGSTRIDSKRDEDLLRRWKGFELWPLTAEYATAISGSKNERGEWESPSFSNFCPEVTYDRFGYFALSMSRYADELDRDLQHEQLGRMRAPSTDWRWTWADLRPMHYSECPLYSPLNALSSKSNEDVGADVTLKIPYVADVRFKLKFGRLKELLRTLAQRVGRKILP
jgi:hypothetical protein